MAFCFNLLQISLIPDELILNSDGLEFEVLYHWQNPNVIRMLGVLIGMQSEASM